MLDFALVCLISLSRRLGLAPRIPPGLPFSPPFAPLFASLKFSIFALHPLRYSNLGSQKDAQNPTFSSQKTTEIFVFCSRCSLILLFSLFCFFGRARQERSILKRSKIETVNISLDREQIHLPKTPKREPPETRFLRKKHRLSKRLQNGIVKIS